MQSSRIALFSPTMEGGGAERVMLTLAHAFRALGHVVDLVLITASGPYLKDLDPAIRLVDLGSTRALRSFVPLLGYLRERRPEFMISTLGQANIIAILARALGAPSLKLVVREAVTLTAVTESTQSRKEKVLYRLLPHAYRYADAIVAPSSGVAADLAALMGASRPPIATIPNPVDSRALRELARAPNAHRWCDDGGDPIIVYVGRLTAQKDPETLLAAFERVLAKRPARLLLLGEGEDRQKLQGLIAAKGLSARVDMPGFATNPFRVLRRAAVYVLSSRFEGLPNALLQALAVGTPVVATDCPSGPREILENGKWGCLVPVGDVSALAEAICATLESPRDAMPAELFESRYGVEYCARKYLELLESTRAR